MAAERPQNLEVSANSLMVRAHTHTKKMLQPVLLVYAEENSINLNILETIIIIIQGLLQHFKKLSEEWQTI